MNIIKLSQMTAIAVLTFSGFANAILGPIPIYLNTEYRTESPVIGAIASSIKLSRSDIENSGAHSFGELLERTPGVVFEGGQGNLTALRIRGNEAGHTLLLVDGAVVSITATQPNLDVIPLDQIQRIEITKGPFSSLYGPGAIGGAIHVFTHQDAKPGRQTQLGLNYGTHNSKKLSLSSSIRDDEHYLHYSFSDYHSDGIDSTGDGDLDPIDRTSGSFNIGGAVDDNTQAQLHILKTNADIEYDASWGVSKPDNNLTQFNLGLSHQFSKDLLSKLNYIKQDTQRREDQYQLNVLSFINEYNLDKDKLTIGLESNIDKDIDNSKQIKHQDLFSQYQTRFKQHEISIGARVVDHDQFSQHYTYNLNWAKDLADKLRVNLAFGKATKLPNHYQNNQNLSNGQTSLKPEHSKNLELGISQGTKNSSWSVKLYKSRLSDAFKYEDPDSNYLTAYYINDGRVDIQGLELSASTRLANWKLHSNYDYNRAINHATQLQKGRRPNHALNLSAETKQGRYHHRINWKLRSKVWDKDDHSNGQSAGYALLNLSSSYEYDQHTRLSIALNNALDKEYTMAKGYNTLGRTVNLGLDYRF